MTAAILAALAPDASLGALARSYPMPCCVLVALALRVAASPSLVDLAGAGSPPIRYQRLVDGVARVDRRWWAAMMIADVRALWSVLGAAAELTGGIEQAPRTVGGRGGLPAPSLTPGRAHVIQRWRDGDGHTYLVLAGGGPLDPVTVLQSSEHKGYRVSLGSWDGTAGLAGWDVGSVELPIA